VRTALTTSISEAAAYIRRGGVVAFPTETVYGLGANVFDELAVAKIFKAKQRPPDNPLIAHIAEIGQIAELAAEVGTNARKFVNAFFPGPLTIVLRRNERVPLLATAGLDTIGIRMPGYELAHRFLLACETPVVAPSANLSGRPSPTTWQAVAEDLDGRIDCILQGSGCEIGLESTVVDCSGPVPLLLRSGAISLTRLREVVEETSVYVPVPNEKPKSPGLIHKHYAPFAKVLIIAPGAMVHDAERAAYIGLTAPAQVFDLTRICGSAEDYAHSFFEFFRECDRQKIRRIYCGAVDESGIGAALMDRLRRSADG
jgi:L-threonylcarbamoyladenylate synthase